MAFNKKGSVLVEAAMIWPILFLCLFFVGSMCFVLYAQAGTAAAMHKAQREVGGRWTETVAYEGFQPGGTVEEQALAIGQKNMEQCAGLSPTGHWDVRFSFLPVYSQLEFSKVSVYGGRMWTPGKRRGTQESCFYIVDEAQLIRNYDYARELAARGNQIRKEEKQGR